MNFDDTDRTSEEKNSTLLPLILRFVNSDIRSIRVEILEELVKQLQYDRKDLSSMMASLDQGRGFSEEASASTLHQFVIRLLEVSFSKGKISKCKSGHVWYFVCLKFPQNVLVKNLVSIHSF